MSGLIKMAEVAAAPVRALPAGPKPTPALSAEQALVESLQRQLATVRETLADRDAEIAGHAKAIEDAFLAGEAAGRKAGLAQAEARGDEALASLKQGIDAAVARFTVDLEALERLAGLLAMEGLGKVLGGEQGYADLIRATLTHHLAGIGAASVLRVEVSTADFPEPADIEALSAAIGNPNLEVRAEVERPAGDCHIKLRLGAIEVGIGQQWESLQALLVDTAGTPAP